MCLSCAWRRWRRRWLLLLPASLTVVASILRWCLRKKSAHHYPPSRSSACMSGSTGRALESSRLAVTGVHISRFIFHPLLVLHISFHKLYINLLTQKECKRFCSLWYVIILPIFHSSVRFENKHNFVYRHIVMVDVDCLFLYDVFLHVNLFVGSPRDCILLCLPLSV